MILLGPRDTAYDAIASDARAAWRDERPEPAATYPGAEDCDRCGEPTCGCGTEAGT